MNTDYTPLPGMFYLLKMAGKEVPGKLIKLWQITIILFLYDKCLLPIIMTYYFISFSLTLSLYIYIYVYIYFNFYI